MTEDKFWVVWSPKSGEPTRTHYSFLDAHREAKRLARKEPQKVFYVMAPTTSCKVRDLDVTYYK